MWASMRMKKFAEIFLSFVSASRLTQASAALSYYLTMTFFPLLIVVYALLEENMDKMLLIFAVAERLLSDEVAEFITDFFSYIQSGDRMIMLPLGLTLLISYASAGIRSIHHSIGTMQGGAEHKGISSYIASILYSLAMLAILYFSLMTMLIGNALSGYLKWIVPGISSLTQWLHLPYIILWALLFLLLCGIYHAPKRREDKYPVAAGALISSLCMVVISPVFSMFMGRSVKYSLVYGSIASLVLLMLWLYMCCLILYFGAAYNIVIYNIKNRQDN